MKLSKYVLLCISILYIAFLSACYDNEEPEQVAPYITLNALDYNAQANWLYAIHLDSTYVDPGFTVSDAKDCPDGATGNTAGSICGMTVDIVVKLDNEVVETLDTSVETTYVLEYTVKDSDSNTAVATRNVSVILDNVAPTILLTGGNYSQTSTLYRHSFGKDWEEPGCTVIDIVPEENLVCTYDISEVNFSVIGVRFNIMYYVEDSKGNYASASRQVIIEDSTSPNLVLTGCEVYDFAAPETCTFTHVIGSSYPDPGYTAIDDYDGDITSSVRVDSTNLNVNAVGTYYIIYRIEDASGNLDYKIRYVNVVEQVDETPPEVTLRGLDPLTVEVNSIFNDPGITAFDDVEGDISFRATADYTNFDITEIGTYTITYNVSDTSGNANSITRTVHVVDTTAPVLSVASTITLEVFSTYTIPAINFSDNYDTSCYSLVVGGDTVDTYTIGNYSVTFTCTDSNGNSSSTVASVIQVRHTSLPVITLQGQEIVTLSAGSTYNDAGATCITNYGYSGLTDNGDSTYSCTSVLTTTNPVNTSAVGTYTVLYNYVDPSGNVAVQVSRTVVVKDTTAPEITLLNSPSVTFYYDAAGNSTYQDYGVACYDNIDGNCTSSVIVDDSALDLHTNGDYKVGTYTIRYSYEDNGGNLTSITRTVTIVDNVLANITLGSYSITSDYGEDYTLPTYTCYDNYDGDCTGSVVIDDSEFNKNSVSTYTIYFSYADTNGNTHTGTDRIQLSVSVINENIPEITLTVDPVSGTTTTTIEVGGSYTEPGYICEDIVIGSCYDLVLVDSSSLNTNVLGTYYITYDYTDAYNNVAITRTRTVRIVDTTNPVISLIDSANVTHEVNTTYTDSGYTCTDNYDGSITDADVTKNISISTLGDQTYTYRCTDSSGNSSEISRTVTVVDTTPPVITLTGSSTVYLEYKATYVDLGYTCSDNYEGNCTTSVDVASNLDNAALGTYTITYSYTDTNTNFFSIDRTIIVQDTTKPVILLNGTASVGHYPGEVYTDLGAVCTDGYDDDKGISLNLTVSDNVNVDVVGLYNVTYNCTDSEGNVADTVTRTVNVTESHDTEAPVISLTGDSLVIVEAFGAYTESGATATDNLHTDINSTLAITGVYDLTTVGLYVLTYTVTDAGGNFDTVTRTIQVVDTTAPVITVTNPTVTHEVFDTYVDSGVTCSDVYDDYHSIAISPTSTDNININVLGTYTITYQCRDSENNSAIEVTKTVEVIDTAKPVLTLNGASTVYLEVHVDTFNDLGAVCNDDYYGQISNNVAGVHTIDNTTVGTYYVTYNCIDGSTNSAEEITRTVIVQDTEKPVITLTGDSTITLEYGVDTYVENGATCSDNYDGDCTLDIVIDASELDVNTVGIYSIYYDVTDTQTNEAIQVVRTVRVVDTESPVVTLTGSSTIYLNVHVDSYTEYGATCSDNYYTGLSVSIDYSAVDTSVVNTYTVAYNCIDGSTNSATTVYRTVIVEDNEAPVITITGDNPYTIAQHAVYTDEGATCTDNYDLTCSVTVSGISSIDTSVSGSYIVTYTAQDVNGNTSSVTREVKVSDDTKAVITLVSSDEITVELLGTYTKPTYTCVDNVDGDCTSSVDYDNSNVDVTNVGEYTITLNYTDSSNNESDEITITVYVVDTTPPVITLVGGSTVVLEYLDTYVELGATCSDNYYTGLVANIKDMDIDNTTLGNYTVTYECVDGSGIYATEVTRTVSVEDNTPPVITLIGDNPLEVQGGSEYVEPGFTCLDNYDGDCTTSVVTSSNFNTTILGTYTITYNVMDIEGNNAVQVTRTIEVIDTLPPTVTLIGESSITHELGNVYIDEGVECEDLFEGDCSSIIVAVYQYKVNEEDEYTSATSVSGFVGGYYLITYYYNDFSSNNSNVVTREIYVRDSVPPILTLIGPSEVDMYMGQSYYEYGILAYDAYDGIVSYTVTHSIDVNTEGSYTVTYTASDSFGNTDSISRTVNVLVSVPYVELVVTNTNVETGVVQYDVVYLDPSGLISSLELIYGDTVIDTFTTSNATGRSYQESGYSRCTVYEYYVKATYTGGTTTTNIIGVVYTDYTNCRVIAVSEFNNQLDTPSTNLILSDIDLYSNFGTWTTPTTTYSRNVYGLGSTISNFTASITSQLPTTTVNSVNYGRYSLFGPLNGATIQDLTVIADISIDYSVLSNQSVQIAVLTSEAIDSVFKNVNVIANINVIVDGKTTSAVDLSELTVAGIAAYSEGSTFENVHTEVNINVQAPEYNNITASGIVGTIGGSSVTTITNSSTTGTITTSSARYVGGLVGNSESTASTVITQSYSALNIEVVRDSSSYVTSVGQLVGSISGTGITMTDVYSAGSVSVDASNTISSSKLYVSGGIGQILAEGSTFQSIMINSYVIIYDSLERTVTHLDSGIGLLVGYFNDTNASINDILVTSDIHISYLDDIGGSPAFSNIGFVIGYVESGSMTSSNVYKHHNTEIIINSVSSSSDGSSSDLGITLNVTDASVFASSSAFESIFTGFDTNIWNTSAVDNGYYPLLINLRNSFPIKNT